MSKKAGSVRHQASVSPIPSHEALFGPIRIGAAGARTHDTSGHFGRICARNAWTSMES